MKKTKDVIKEQGVLDIYEGLLKKIWERIVLTLGAVTVAALFRRVIRITTQRFPFIKELGISNEGLNFSQLKKKIGEGQSTIIKEGFEELIINFFELLAELTGDMIVDNLFKEKIMKEIKG